MSKRERTPRVQSKSIPVALTSSVSVSARVIRASKERHHGSRAWDKLQFVQLELWAIYPDGPPQTIRGHDKALVKEINERLAANSRYQAMYPGAKVSNMTIKRALDELRKANG